MNDESIHNHQFWIIIFSKIFLQKQSDKDDEANGPNDFCELVNNKLWITHYSSIHKIHNAPI